jgi:hypothetical protein
LAEGAALLLREIDQIEMLVSIPIGKSNANGRLAIFVLVLSWCWHLSRSLTAMLTGQ